MGIHFYGLPAPRQAPGPRRGASTLSRNLAGSPSFDSVSGEAIPAAVASMSLRGIRAFLTIIHRVNHCILIAMISGTSQYSDVNQYVNRCNLSSLSMALADKDLLDYVAANPGARRDDIHRNVSPEVTVWRRIKALVEDHKLQVPSPSSERSAWLNSYIGHPTFSCPI